MKRTLLLIATFFVAINVFAQDSDKIKRWSTLELTMAPINIIELTTTQGIIYDRFAVGLTVGLGENLETWREIYGHYIPLYLTAQFDLTQGTKVVPYFAVKAGAEFYVTDGLNPIMYALHPSFGIKYKNFYSGLGFYNAWRGTYTSSYLLSLSIGYNF